MYMTLIQSRIKLYVGIFLILVGNVMNVEGLETSSSKSQRPSAYNFRAGRGPTSHQIQPFIL